MTEPKPPAELFSLEGRVALVTGASAGLGARFGQVLARAGAKVVLAARRADRLESLARDLPGAVAMPTDLLDDVAIADLVAKVVDRFGRIDVLVNNAGAVDRGSALELPVEDFRSVLALNLVVPFLLARTVARQMTEGAGGSIVNVASINGLVASRSWPETAYVASKGGLVTLTRELANQWATHGVRVNAIAPGYFPTEMTRELLGDQQGIDSVSRHTPMRRPGRPHELDGALLFLASDASSYMTGQIVVVDGGWTVV